YNLHLPTQYIFGDFSPDEFNQFFVTPRSSVEDKNIRELSLVSMKSLNPVTLCREPPATVFQAH
uniref:Ubiquitin specific peptidase 10 n=1 Tax=Saimiri boliviensis boliviensis TaxID=39432 RepID=A0A2K6S162_SAIBB